MLKTGENIIVQLPMWIEDSSRIEALMLTNSKPGRGSGGISHKLFPPFNSAAPHFRKDGCILRYGFYQDCPFWRIGPSFVLKGSNTDGLDFFHMMVHRVGVKVPRSYSCSVPSVTLLSGSSPCKSEAPTAGREQNDKVLSWRNVI